MQRFIVLILLVLFLITGTAQNRKKAPVKPVQPGSAIGQTNRTPVYSIESFDTHSDMLPEKYRGHDGEEIYKAFQERLTPKGEFETSEAYRDRIKNAALRPIVGSLTIANIFAFELQRRIFEYDADNQSLITGVPLTTAHIKGEEQSLFRSLMLDVGGSYKKETYQGSNAFGANVEITKTTAMSYDLAVSNWMSWQTEDYVEPSYRSLSGAKHLAEKAILNRLILPPSQAEQLKPNLRLLAICRLQYPFIDTGSIYIKPTFDRPRESILLLNYLYVELIEMWAYDISSGKVLYRRRANDVNSGSPPTPKPPSKTGAARTTQAPTTQSKTCFENGRKIPCS